MKRFLAVSICLALIFIFAGVIMAHHPPTPSEIEGVTIISSDKVNALINNRDVYMYDSRKAWHYIEGHIKNAISLPYNFTTLGDIQERKGKFDMLKLPSNKDVIIIFYDDGVHGWHSYNSAKAAKNAGYKNIMWFRDGYEDWGKKGYPIEQYGKTDK